MEPGSSAPDDPPSDPFDALLERAARLTPLPRAATPRVHPGLELWNGRFQVRRRIGAGGMGVVHEAFDRERGGEVAIKTLSRLDALGIYRMKHEFRALAEVTHPNLVQLHELFADGDLWLFTMELVRGERFDTWVRPSGILAQPRLRAALPQLVAGVRAIHAAGKLHRDLKPSNVLVTREGRVVILDFGLVADPELGGEGQTLDGDNRSGTPAYMAPEQAAGDAATAASDWYAVGVMIYEALTGNLPFSGRSQAIMERKQVEPVPNVPSSTAHDLDALCAGLLAREPEARPSAERIAEVAAAGASAESARAPVEVAMSKLPRALGLVGRDAELGVLRAACAEAEAGKAVVVRVYGESGMGKSAVVQAFLDELRASRRAVVLSGRCYERESVPYKAFDRVIDELTRYLRQLREVDAAALIPRDIGALARIFPVLHRVDVIADAPMRPAASDHELRRRAFDAFAELLACMRDREPLVVHIDDLQWSDDDSLVLLEHLLGRAEAVPLLLVIGSHALAAGAPLRARVERAVQANARCALHDLALGPLAPAATLELARALLGDAASPQLAQAVAAESEGSPFFAGELARYALEIGVDADRLSLEQAICNRAAHLGGAAERVLELLAISGRPTSSKVLARACGTTDETLRAIARLRTAQLVREAGAHVYECYHDRIRVAIAERMAEPEARERHARLIAALAIDDADPERLFEHARASGERERAGGYAVQAAARASASLAFERSAALLGHAIELLPEDEIARMNLRERRAEALSLCGRWSDAARAFEDAADHIAQRDRGMQLLRQSALHFLGSGQSLEGLPRLRRVYAAAGIAWPKTRTGAMLWSTLRMLWLWLRGAPRPDAPRAAGAELEGEPGEAAVLERLIEAAGFVPPYDLARGLYFMSAFAVRALHRGDVAQVGLALGMSAMMFAGVRVTRRFGCRLVDEACALARGHEMMHLRSATLCFAASARVLEGRLQEGLALAAEAEACLEDGGRAYIYGTWTARALQSHALIELGSVGRAAALFEQNARLARDVGDDMAILGGDSALRYLVDDDVAGAHALIERKQQALTGTEPIGVLHDMLHIEKMMCALYEGRAGEQAWRTSVLGSGNPTFFDAHALVACCALQAPDADQREKERAVRDTIRRLRGEARSDPRSAGMITQLRAALAFMHGDILSTLAELARAREYYVQAGFALHAAIARWHIGRLRGDHSVAREAEQFLRAQGIANPKAWARMLASGFGADV